MCEPGSKDSTIKHSQCCANQSKIGNIIKRFPGELICQKTLKSLVMVVGPT